jgi:glycosyltransferase involved in cell wall biosynthesis
LQFVVFVNAQAQDVLQQSAHNIKLVYIPALNNQLTKAFWLEFQSTKVIECMHGLDVFWIPSGTNSFPGLWKVPSVVTFHDLGEYLIKNKYDFKRTVYRKFICVPRSIKRSEINIAVSNTTAMDMRNLFNANAKVIYSGCSPRQNWDNINQVSINENVDAIVGKRPYFFVPGRTDYVGKNLSEILKAFVLLNELISNCRPLLVFAGPKGEAHKLLIEKIENLNLIDDVKYVGRVEDDVMDRLYRHCVCTIIASQYEGFGFPVLEAMANGVPIICSNAGALPEVGGGAALFYNIGDISLLAEHMKSLFKDGHVRDVLVCKGLQRASMFSWEKCYKEMVEVFCSIKSKG